MKVLLVGATGKLGLRLLPALLTHHHTVVAYVRSSTKLHSLIPRSIASQITVVEGDAIDSAAIARAILDNACDALINTAGDPPMAPWTSSVYPQLFAAVVRGARDAQARRAREAAPLRCWFMGGLGMMPVPGVEGRIIMDYLPLFHEHTQTFAGLEKVPLAELRWSMLCSGYMKPARADGSVDFEVPTRVNKAGFEVGTALPRYRDSWFRRVPLLGTVSVIGMNAGRYNSTLLEENVDFIAEDLDVGKEKFVGCRVTSARV